jgi:uncharacterized protein with PQ loop repeat
MAASFPTARTPHWYGIPVRVALVTFLGTLISFALSLLFGILGTVIFAAMRRVHPDMRVAYRQIALPIAIVAGCIILVTTLVIEIRRYRQSKTLSAIERMS